MPNPYYAELDAKTTEELADMLSTIAFILKERMIPETHEVEEMRGGIRPTTIHNP